MEPVEGRDCAGIGDCQAVGLQQRRALPPRDVFPGSRDKRLVFPGSRGIVSVFPGIRGKRMEGMGHRVSVGPTLMLRV